MTQSEKDQNCKNAQKVASKYGYQLVCEDDDMRKEENSGDPGCEDAKKVAGKYGYEMICED